MSSYVIKISVFVFPDFNQSYCLMKQTTHEPTTTTTSSSTQSNTTSKTTPSPTTDIKTTVKTTKETTFTTTSVPSFCQSNMTNPVLLPGSCNFEVDTCGIQIIRNDTDTAVAWLRTNQRHGKVPPDNIPGDHTYSEGKLNDTCS